MVIDVPHNSINDFGSVALARSNKQLFKYYENTEAFIFAGHLIQ